MMNKRPSSPLKIHLKTEVQNVKREPIRPNVALSDTFKPSFIAKRVNSSPARAKP